MRISSGEHLGCCEMCYGKDGCYYKESLSMRNSLVPHFVACLCFQNPHLNQNAWNNLEKYSRSLTKHNKNVFVCTGPLYLPR